MHCVFVRNYDMSVREDTQNKNECYFSGQTPNREGV